MGLFPATYIEPGKPIQNAFIESFYGKLQDECLNENWVSSILYEYPNRPSCFPVDDSDIIDKAVLWAKENGPNIREEFLRLHPHLKDRFEIALKSSELSGPIIRHAGEW